MASVKQSLWQRYVPGHTGNPFRLAWKLLTERKPAARSALFMAAAGIALAPVDVLLSRRESRIYESAPDPELPLVLVCGPPRSGTTLVAQYLINTLDVNYINNLTSLFPRAPIYASRLFGRWIRNRPGGYDAFYGRSRGLEGANDGLYIWDRWLGPDREHKPARLVDGSNESMRQFFGAMQDRARLPIVNKANRLVTCADLVAAVLPSAYFICLRRDPVMLAQSLLIARGEITGNAARPYGIHHDRPTPEDPIEDVCRQVEFYDGQIKRQQELLGSRFMVVQYENFCSAPRSLIEELKRVWHLQVEIRAGESNDIGFDVSNVIRLPAAAFRALEQRLDVEGHG